MKKKIVVIVVSMILVIGFIIIKQNKKTEYNKSLFYMDTYIDIKIYTDREKEVSKIFSNIDKIYKKYHELTNFYDENSELYKLNNSNEEIIELSDELYDILEFSLDYKNISNKFNINIGNITKIWKEYREKQNGIPTLEELNDAYIDSEIILLGDNKIKNTHLNIDLGGIAKGYATSIASQYLEDNNITNYIINAGGNVAVGESYNKKYFNIGIEDPTKSSEIYKIIKGNNISVATSGGYERFYEYEGIKYHHIIDPDTLFPANNMLSVTVIANDSKIADIMSTILFLLPVNEALGLVNSLTDIEAIFYIDEDNIITSKGFNKYE